MDEQGVQPSGKLCPEVLSSIEQADALGGAGRRLQLSGAWIRADGTRSAPGTQYS